MDDFKDLIMMFFFSIIFTVLTFVTLFGIISIPTYYGSCKQADVYNKQNKTSYTCSDFFWADNQINQQVQTINLK